MKLKRAKLTLSGVDVNEPRVQSSLAQTLENLLFIWSANAMKQQSTKIYFGPFLNRSHRQAGHSQRDVETSYLALTEGTRLPSSSRRS